MKNEQHHNRIPSCLRTVRFQDCDPFNHLNNGRYFDYFMNAREDHLIEFYDLNIYSMAAQTGKSWVVASSKISFLKPAFLMENVLIESQVIQFSEKEILVEMRMFTANRKSLKSVLWCTFVPFDIKTGKREMHDTAMMEFLDSVYLAVDEKHYDDRVAKLIEMQKQIT